MKPAKSRLAASVDGSIAVILGGLLHAAAATAEETSFGWDCHLTPAGLHECVAQPSAVPARTAPPPAPKTTTPAPPPVPAVARPPAPAAAPPTPVSAERAEAIAEITLPDEPVDDPWGLCAPSGVRPPPPDSDALEAARRSSAIDIAADSVKLRDDRIYTLKGNVALRRADQQIEARRIVYDKQEGTVEAEGEVQYTESRVSLSGEQIHLDMNTNHAELAQVGYTLPASHARGGAERVRLEGPAVQRLDKATYTTCDADQEDWRLSAKKVTLRQEEGVGTARHVTMRFKKVPILYTPFLSFPLDDRRKSGFLAPTIGGSEESGADLRIPYYWNIAPHRDATITPRWLEKRGAQIGGEFRYLNRLNRGKAHIEYLPSDDEYGEDRSLVSLEHRGGLTPRLSTTVLFKEVSDRQYFEDLGDTLNLASITHLERRVELNYRGNSWNLIGRVQDYQTVDETIAEADRPYERMPQLRLAALSPWRPFGLHARLDAEYTYFDHEVNVAGHRLDVQPRLALPVHTSGWFFTPQAALRHTRYELDDPLEPGKTQKPDRTTPIYSVDSGLFFERNSTWGKRTFLQTLEPRAYYLYVPERAQDDLPVFDTGRYDFQLSRLFEENRFSGPDRMGDANQLTLALTSRIMDPFTGEQHLSASIGEIFYFRDLDVTLPGDTPVTDNQSDLVGDFALRLFRRWELSSGLQWNPNESRTERAQARIQYRPGPAHILNLSYRFRRDELEQVDASFLWQLSRQWRAVGRWNYAIDDDTTLEAFGGFEYDSCCWAMRLVGRNYINDTDGAKNRSVYMQVEFKGLGAVGKPVEELLERGILGYRRN